MVAAINTSGGIENTINNKKPPIPEANLLCDDPEEIRTPDRRLRRPLLYPAELLGHMCNNNGAGEGNRTLASSLGSWRSAIELHPHGNRNNCKA